MCFRYIVLLIVGTPYIIWILSLFLFKKNYWCHIGNFSQFRKGRCGVNIYTICGMLKLKITGVRWSRFEKSKPVFTYFGKRVLVMQFLTWGSRRAWLLREREAREQWWEEESGRGELENHYDDIELTAMCVSSLQNSRLHRPARPLHIEQFVKVSTLTLRATCDSGELLLFSQNK